MATCAALASASLYTATVLIPRRLHVRITRHAISPRLATSTLLGKGLRGMLAAEANALLLPRFAVHLTDLMLLCLSIEVPSCNGRGMLQNGLELVNCGSLDRQATLKRAGRDSIVMCWWYEITNQINVPKRSPPQFLLIMHEIKRWSGVEAADFYFATESRVPRSRHQKKL